MATWYLLNCIRFKGPAGATVLSAGDQFNDAVTPLAPMQAAGAVFAPTSNANVATAAALAQQRKRGGAQPGELNSIMLAAAIIPSVTAERKTSQGAAGATVAAGAAIAPAISFTPSFSGKLLIRAWASIQGLTSGTFTPILKVGTTTVAAPAQYTGESTTFPRDVFIEVEVDGNTVGSAETISFVTTAGDATVTLGHGSTGAGAGMSVTEVP